MTADRPPENDLEFNQRLARAIAAYWKSAGRRAGVVSKKSHPNAHHYELVATEVWTNGLPPLETDPICPK